MSPITVPMIVKNHHPVLTWVLLAAVGAAIAFVVYMLCRHAHRTHTAKKHGHSPHTGHHGNH